MADPNVGVLLSTTLKNYRQNLVDQIHKSNALFFMLKEKGAIKEEAGGERIVQPILYAKNSTAGSYDSYDSLDTTPQTGIDSAEYNWKQYSASITISGKEERQNSGDKYRIIDLLDAKTKQAMYTLKETIGNGIFSDGTGNGSKDLTGLVAMVAATGTYGGISSSANTWWQSYVETTSEALTLAKLRVAFNTPTLGGKDHANLIVTTQSLFESYEGLLTTTTSTFYSADTKKLGDGGFQTLEFKGVPFVFDELCNSGVVYFLNTEHMKLVVHKDANFETTDFVKPENQDAKVAQILFMGNLTCDRRKSFSKLTAKT